jgi:hypothetical protein
MKESVLKLVVILIAANSLYVAISNSPYFFIWLSPGLAYSDAQMQTASTSTFNFIMHFLLSIIIFYFRTPIVRRVL